MHYDQFSAPSGLYLGFSVQARPGLGAPSPFQTELEPEQTPQVEVALTEAPFPLLIQEREDGTVALRHPFTGHFISWAAGALTAELDEGPCQSFRRVPRDNDPTAVVLLASDGVHSLSEPSPGQLALLAGDPAQATAFRTESLPQGDHGHGHGCCSGGLIGQQQDEHTEDGPGVLWDTGSHERALERTIKMMAAFPTAGAFMELWNALPGSTVPPGRQAAKDLYLGSGGSVYRGLYDADYEDRYTDPIAHFPISRSYRTHFYDPATRKNYLARSDNAIIAAVGVAHGLPLVPSVTDISAMTEGQRYFNLAVHHGRRIVREPPERRSWEPWAAAGHYLGLYLHFLTDLAQPMHAANLTALDGEWNRRHVGLGTSSLHSRFESGLDEGDWPDTAAGRTMEQAALGEADLTMWADRQQTSMGVFIHETVAVYSKGQLGRLPSRWEDCLDFTNEATRAYLHDTLRLVPNHIARGLMAWLECCKQPFPLNDQTWYTIGELTAGEVLCRKQNDGSYLGRWAEEGPIPEDKLFCLVFNSDGTCSLVCKRGSEYKRVTATRKATGWAFEFTDTKAGDPQTSFRVVPGHEGHLWLFWGELALSIWTGGIWDGYACAWYPLDGMVGGACGFPERPSIGQVFDFRPQRTLTDGEKRSIPDWGKHDEWGRPRSA